MSLTLDELKEIIPNPKWIVEQLDKYVIGQETAKKTLALLVLNRALIYLASTGKLELSVDLYKSNALLIGPSGVGKTALIHALAAICDIPIYIYDVSNLTASGYIGGKVEDILIHHTNNVSGYVAANYNKYKEDLASDGDYFEIPSTGVMTLSMAEFGIIYLDEVDKIKNRSSSDGTDINGDMIQNEMLKLLEGNAKVMFSTNNRTPVPDVLRQGMNTKNIFFVLGGAFSGLDKIIERRLFAKDRIGFHNEISERSKLDAIDNVYSLVTTEDLVSYGFKPEFLGRIPLRAVLNPLTLENMVHIITEPTNSILSQYKEMFKLYSLELVFEDAAIKAIASKALELNTGARSLKNLFHNILRDELYNLYDRAPGESIVITEEMVNDRCSSI